MPVPLIVKTYNNTQSNNTDAYTKVSKKYQNMCQNIKIRIIYKKENLKIQ